MGKIRHYYVGACLLVSSAAFAQVPSHSMYVNESSKSVPFYEAYSNWQPGTPLFSDTAAEDEEFFISRVKPKERFINSATQVDPEMTPDRKLIWWCPIGTADGGGGNHFLLTFLIPKCLVCGAMWIFMVIGLLL